jgi:hypothetical protein
MFVDLMAIQDKTKHAAIYRNMDTLPAGNIVVLTVVIIIVLLSQVTGRESSNNRVKATDASNKRALS